MGRELGLLRTHSLHFCGIINLGWLKVGAHGDSEAGLMVFKPQPEPSLSSVQVHERVGDGGWGDHS